MTKRPICAATLLFTVLLGAAEAAPYKQAPQARQAPSAPRPPSTPAAPALPARPGAVQVVTLDDDRGARDTRDRLRKLLEQYPPSVRQVLRIDSSLLSRPDYLATYPALAAFLEQHPEVVHNPAYFVGDANGIFMGDPIPNDPKIEAIRGWRNFVEFVPVVAIVFIITSALAGLIRTLIDQRRWQRAARMQMDLQNKLIDRFSGHEELLAYVQSPAGRGLSELQLPSLASGSAQRTPLMIDAPLGRIFWSLQAGIVLSAAGIGLHVLGGHIAIDEMSGPVAGLGALVIAIGVGFIVSAAASYLISHRLGLITRETPGA